MERHFEQSPSTAQLRGVIPRRYQHLSGIADYDFYIWDVFCYGKVAEIMRFQQHKPARRPRVEIRRDQDPQMYDLLFPIGELRHRRPYRERYLNAYKCMEILTSDIPEDYRAIRHSLAHPPTILAKPNTVSILKKHFGSTRIDLAVHSHRKVFFQMLGNMLMNNDSLLYERLRKIGRI